MPGLGELTGAARRRLEWLLAKQVVSSGGLSSWDLIGLDVHGRILSVDAFHLEAPFPVAGTRWAESFATQQQLALLGAWGKATKPGMWVIRTTAQDGPVSDPDVHVRPRRRIWRAARRAQPDVPS